MRIKVPPIFPLHHVLSEVVSWLLVLAPDLDLFLGLIVANGFCHSRDWSCQVQVVLACQVQVLHGNPVVLESPIDPGS
jgi:hypothetical protein